MSSLNVRQLAKMTREAGMRVAALDHDARNNALEAIAGALHKHQQQLFAANRRDCEYAKRNGLASSLMRRLHFSRDTLDAVISGIRATINLPDPLGQTLEARELDERLNLFRRTVPIGVLGFIFESRPDALVQIATLALKSGNAALLKGGSEAEQTNNALVKVIHGALENTQAPAETIGQLHAREHVEEMIALDDIIDVIIPRGSNEFVRSIINKSAIPVLGHADGICHIYIDEHANHDMARAIILDAKTQYPAVCNAMETLLMHAAHIDTLAPLLIQRLIEAGVTIYGCERAMRISTAIKAADKQQWGREYLDLSLSMRIVDTLNEAIVHINHFGSHHTDAIISESTNAVHQFMAGVDSATVIHNASTRFADGYRYGLGAEVGISTGKIHARGPVGLSGLTSSKWMLYGDGHIVADYIPPHGKTFTHRPLPHNT